LLTELLRELRAQDIEISLELGCALKLRLEVSLNLLDLLRDRSEHPWRGGFAGRASWSRRSLRSSHASRAVHSARPANAPLATSVGALCHVGGHAP
jgi:hypothetical protein